MPLAGSGAVDQVHEVGDGCECAGHRARFAAGDRTGTIVPGDWVAPFEDFGHNLAHYREVGRLDGLGPLADPSGWMASLTEWRRAGYRIEVVALAVPEAVSQLGVLDRCLRLAEDGAARYVSWDSRGACAAALPRALEAVETGGLADRVTVVRRGAGVVYANELDGGGRWRRPVGAAEAVDTEWARPWSAAETGAFRRRLADADRRAHDPRLPADWALAIRRDAERAAALAEPVRRTTQPRRDAPGADYHRLSAEEHRWIFDHLIVPDLLEGITPQESPIAVFFMGNPVRDSSPG
ncbi:zeta toxin family protein [Streptomyces clavuligerus]|uniref:zeta toxin family protein n=1 Tax=Streptomyces clavuligerus TaxID=1901 RepID=UPI001E4702AA|nr:zeta toxin family protein [Streptomyces clavuligerus]